MEKFLFNKCECREGDMPRRLARLTGSSRLTTYLDDLRCAVGHTGVSVSSIVAVTYETSMPADRILDAG